MSILESIPQPVGWFEQQQQTVNALRECPIPVGCSSQYLSLEGDQLTCTTDHNGGTRCPLYSKECDLGKRRSHADLQKYLLKIKHAEMLPRFSAVKSSMAIRELAATRSNFVILAASCGRGKDFAVARKIFHEGRRVYWFKAYHLVRMVAKGDTAYESAMHGAPGDVVIEDLGKESDKAIFGQGETSEIIVQAIDDLIGAGHRVFITTNLSKDSLQTKYGGRDGRFASRVKAGKYIAIPDSEPDYRTLEVA